MNSLYSEFRSNGARINKVNGMKIRKALAPYLPAMRLKACGLFDPRSGKIWIKKTLPNYCQAITLLHEVGHLNCWEKVCSCCTYNNDEFKSEFHAEKFCLQYLYSKPELKNLLIIVMYEAMIIKSVYKRFPDLKIFYNVWVKLMKTPLWKKCMILHGKKVNQLWRNSKYYRSSK